jgi:hypothetical protein
MAHTVDLTGYMLTKLDTIREDQVRHGDMLSQLLAAATTSRTTTESRRKRSIRIPKLSPFSQAIAGGGCVWLLGLSTKSYLDHGGDPASLVEALLKIALGFFFGAG